MNSIDFSKAGGFLLEQETLDGMQKSYGDHFFTAFLRQIGVKSSLNYLFEPATKDKTGWVIISGNLIPVQPTSIVTSYIEVITLKEGLQFGTGIHHKIYTNTKARHVSEIPDMSKPSEEMEDFSIEYAYYDLSTFLPVTHVQNLNQHLLPIDGSESMNGDLFLGGNKISSLDVEERKEAIIRAKDLYLNENKVISDRGNVLIINKESGWSNISIAGNPQLKDVKNTFNEYLHPLVSDYQGNLFKSEGGVVGGIPLGLILKWNSDTLPYGWVWCDGNNSEKIQGISIPDLRVYNKANTSYIIYVRYTNRPPSEIIISGKTQLHYTTKTQFASTTLVALAKDPDNDVLAYKWTKVSGNINLEDVYNPELKLENLTAGNYQLQASATDSEGATIETVVTVEVTLVPVMSLQRQLTGEYLKIESYTITIEGAPNGKVSILGKVENNTSLGHIYVHLMQVGILINQKEFEVELDEEGRKSFMVSVGAGNTQGITEASFQIKEQDEILHVVAVQK
ncbi:PKD domain-containing protein [Tenacibaculum xiamenense]|uniref:PKD domain-containing protein n=1 Tax=Tenacibaculum xiamenense TaxID=1261553 RepID=UPI0038960435